MNPILTPGDSKRFVVLKRQRLKYSNRQVIVLKVFLCHLTHLIWGNLSDAVRVFVDEPPIQTYGLKGTYLHSLIKYGIQLVGLACDHLSTNPLQFRLADQFVP